MYGLGLSDAAWPESGRGDLDSPDGLLRVELSYVVVRVGAAAMVYGIGVVRRESRLPRAERREVRSRAGDVPIGLDLSAGCQ